MKGGIIMDLISTSDWQNISLFIPIIVALTEIFKRIGLGKTLLPISNIILGILAAYFFVPSAMYNISMAILIGIIIGLSASGLYSSGKTTIETVKNNKNEK